MDQRIVLIAGLPCVCAALAHLTLMTRLSVLFSSVPNAADNR